MDNNFTKVSFVKSYIIPLFLIFLIPAFSLWFFEHATSSYDEEVLTQVYQSIDHATDITAQEKTLEKNFYKAMPVSKILASSSTEMKGLRDNFSQLSNDYSQFRWGIFISQICIYSSLASLIAVLICVALSFKSQQVQYLSLSIGWHLLKTVSIIQVIGQAILAVGLSYWITALWMNSYIPKLIIIIVILAIAAIGLILGAIFKKVENKFVIEGATLDLEASPTLKNKIEEICKSFNISSPDQVIVGIDDNFFVTEQAIYLDEKIYHGKTLYLSLSLLKLLELEEAEAIIAHEMAHFSGNDTVFTKKISPIMTKYSDYLNALHSGGLSLPVFYFMLFFWSLFQISLSRLSRSREFRADRHAAEITSSMAIANSLAKVTSYAHYRAKIEDNIFNNDAVIENLNISQKIIHGFPSFIEKANLKKDIFDTEAPHPFDSHPEYEARVQNVGLSISDINKDGILAPVKESWHQRIANAPEIEQKLWDKYEEMVRGVHEQILAYKLKPEEPWERDIVTKFFPEEIIKGKKERLLTVDYEKITFNEWDDDVFYADIEDCKVDENIGGHKFTVTFKKKKLSLPLTKFELSKEQILELINVYYSRYLSYEQYLKEKLDSNS